MQQKELNNRPKLPPSLKAKPSDFNNVYDGRVHIFTDGSASTRDKSGGWGAVLVKGEQRKHISGGVANTTIGAMELRAVYEALKCMHHFDDPVIVYSDSQYLVNALTLWWRGWSFNDWMTSSGKPVKNRDLIEAILQISESNPVAFRWVKGHAGNWGNEIADKLAGTARRELLMLNNYKENFRAMANSDVPIGIDQWKLIAERHVSGLHDIGEHERGWACKHPIMLWTYYLSASYLYYEKDENLIPDMEFDNLCRYLLKLGKDKLKESGAYWVDQLWDESAMEAGTGFHLNRKVPIGVQNIATVMYQQLGYRPHQLRTNPDAYLGDDVVEQKRRVRTRTKPTSTNNEKPRVRTRTRSVVNAPQTSTRKRVRRRTKNATVS